MTPLWCDEASGQIWMDPGVTETDLSSREKAALRSWLVQRSLDAWLNAAPAVRDLLELAVITITGGQARTFLLTWGLQPGGRWSHVLDGSYDDDDEDFALYEGACPYDGCRADVLTGFGASGDASDITLAVCQRGHFAYFGPDGQLRVEEEIGNDCWEHQHAGPDRCPECTAREREDLPAGGGE